MRDRRTSLRRPVSALVLALLLAPFAAADTIEKRDGSKLDGQIVEEAADKVVIKTKFGVVTVPRADIIGITKGKTPADEFKDRWSECDKSDVLAMVEVAEFCSTNKLSREEKIVYRRILEVDPDHETARRGLGFENVDGKWVSKKELAEAEARRKEEERKAKADAKKDAGKAGSAAAGKARSAPEIGNVDAEIAPFIEKIKENTQADADAAKLLSDELGLPFRSVTTEHFALRTMMSPDESAKIATFCEKIFAKCHKLFDLKIGTRLWQGQFLLFRVKTKPNFGQLVDYIYKEFPGSVDLEQKAEWIERGSLNAAMPVPLAAGYEVELPLDHAMAHVIPSFWMEWFSRGAARPWLTEGFAAYMAIAEFGANELNFTSLSKYANRVEMADKDSDSAYQQICIDVINGTVDVSGSVGGTSSADPYSWIEMSRKDLNSLDYVHLAKAWSVTDFFIREHMDQFKAYIAKLPFHKEEEECLKQTFGWTAADLDREWSDFVKRTYKPAAAAPANPKDKKKN